MNILYLISYAGKAGTEKYVENLMRTYSAQGHRCFLAYMDGGELAEKAKALGCGVFRLDLRASHALAAAKSIARLCAENGIDVIHAQYPRENVIAVLSRLWRRETRVVFTSHLTVRQSFLGVPSTGASHRTLLRASRFVRRGRTFCAKTASKKRRSA